MVLLLYLSLSLSRPPYTGGVVASVRVVLCVALSPSVSMFSLVIVNYVRFV